MVLISPSAGTRGSCPRSPARGRSRTAPPGRAPRARPREHPGGSAVPGERQRGSAPLRSRWGSGRTGQTGGTVPHRVPRALWTGGRAERGQAWLRPWGCSLLWCFGLKARGEGPRCLGEPENSETPRGPERCPSPWHRARETSAGLVREVRATSPRTVTPGVDFSSLPAALCPSTDSVSVPAACAPRGAAGSASCPLPGRGLGASSGTRGG